MGALLSQSRRRRQGRRDRGPAALRAGGFWPQRRGRALSRDGGRDEDVMWLSFSLRQTRRRSLRKREQGQKALDRRFVALDFHLPGAQGFGELAPVVHQRGQRVRAGREDGIGPIRGAARELEPAASDLGAETVVAQSQ